jgi:hypothetical protein
MSNRKIACGEKDTVLLDSSKDYSKNISHEAGRRKLASPRTCGLGV